MKLKNISKTVGQQIIIKNITLEFQNCGMVFIVGPSGSGKSTLLNIMGLLDDDYSGELYIDNKKIERGENLSLLRRNHFSFIFQECNLINSLNVKENINIALELTGKTVNFEQYEKYAKMVGLDGYDERSVEALSGGEKQRVAILRSMLCGNPIILADEPTGNLDYENSKKIFEYLKTVSKTHLVLVVSHDLSAADEYADRIIHIKDGGVQKDEVINQQDDTLINNTYNDNSVGSFHFKSLFHLCICSLRRRKRKTVSIIMLMTFLLFCIGIILGAVDAMQDMVDQTDKGVLENDKYSITTSLSTYGSERISNEYLEELNKFGDKIHIVEYNKVKAVVSSGEGVSELTYNVVDNSGFFDNRYEIEGSICQKKCEVIIDQNLAYELFRTDKIKEIIGNKVSIDFGMGVEQECIITGIKTTSIKDSGELYITKDLSDAVYSSFRDSDMLFCTNEEGDSVPVVLSRDETEKIVWGRKPEASNEAIVNINGIKDLSYIISSDHTMVNGKDILSDDFDDKELTGIIDSPINISVIGVLYDYLNLRIVGVYEDDSDQIVIYTPEKTFEDLSHEHMECADIYCSDKDTINEINRITEKRGYYLVRMSAAFTDKLQNRMSTIVIVLSFFAIILLFISLISIRFFTRFRIMDRTYEVGVLKAIGMDNRYVFEMFMFENVLIGLVSCIPSVILLSLIKLGPFDKYLVYDSVELYKYNLLHILLIMIISIIITAVSGIFEIRRVSKMNVIDAIRAKYN